MGDFRPGMILPHIFHSNLYAKLLAVWDQFPIELHIHLKQLLRNTFIGILQMLNRMHHNRLGTQKCRSAKRRYNLPKTVFCLFRIREAGVERRVSLIKAHTRIFGIFPQFRIEYILPFFAIPYRIKKREIYGSKSRVLQHIHRFLGRIVHQHIGCICR